MSSMTRYVAVGALAVLVSVSALALGRHHRPFASPPARSHMAPHKDRPLVIEQHAVIEKAPVVVVGTPS